MIIYLTIILFFLIIYNIARYRLRKTYFDFDYEKKNLKNIIDEAKTGDLIFFRYDSGIDYYFIKKTFTNFDHVGIVIEKDNKKYILENLKYDIIKDGKEVKDVILNDLEERLVIHYNNYEEDNTYICKLNKNINVKDNELFLKQLPKYMEEKKFLSKYVELMFFYWLILHHFNITMKYDKNELNCAEFVCFCLEEMKVLPINYNWHHYSTTDILHIKDENGEYLYSNPVEIIIKT